MSAGRTFNVVHRVPVTLLRPDSVDIDRIAKTVVPSMFEQPPWRCRCFSAVKVDLWEPVMINATALRFAICPVAEVADIPRYFGNKDEAVAFLEIRGGRGWIEDRCRSSLSMDSKVPRFSGNGSPSGCRNHKLHRPNYH